MRALIRPRRPAIMSVPMARKSDAPKPVSLDPSMRIVVLYGGERFLIEEHTRRFAEMLEQKFDGLEQFRLDGETVQPAAVLDELRSYGLLQRHKLVILDNAEIFLAGGKGAVEDDDEEGEGAESSAAASAASASDPAPGTRRPLMERYAANPVPDATLLMRAAMWRAGKLDKLIAKVGSIHQCAPLSDEHAADWCVKRCARRYGASIDPAAAEVLVLRLGPDLLHLDTELQKLAAMSGPEQRITRELVADVVGLSREEKFWEIQTAVATGSAPVMLRKLRELLEVSRQDEVPLAWAIGDLLRKLHAASHMLRSGAAPASLYRPLKLWGAVAEPFLQLARRHEPRTFAQLLRIAIETDLHTKSGLGDPTRNLEALLVGIADTVNVGG